MKKPAAGRMLAIATGVMLLAFSSAAFAQYAELHNFDCVADGCNPNMPALLAQGRDGGLYGTMPTQTSGNGTVVSYELSGVFGTVHNFLQGEAYHPQSGLSMGLDGSFYGTSTNGGTPGFGTVYKVSPAGAVTILHTFANGTDGAYPWATPIQASDGNVYGATYNGTNAGVVYKITQTGVFSTIATLASKTQAPFIQAADGNLYGTTQYGGTYNQGTVFKMTTAGKVTIIHSFNSTGDGQIPIGPVMQASDGLLYGLTSTGGQFGQGILYKMTTAGGSYTIVHQFQLSEGSSSPTGLVQGSDGYLYGVMPLGGGNSFGTLFKVKTNGTLFSVVYNFAKATGGNPYATPTLHTNGKIYGLTITGGTTNPADGVIYSYNAGLKPFASLVILRSGKVGSSVGIIGQGFSTATGVQFGTGPGTMQVVSDTYMIAKPATNATTGKVTVLEPGGNLVTPQTYKVLPTIANFNPTSGPVGTVVTINGTSLLQTTAVTFGGVKSTTVTIVSDTQITAVVPTGAKTGKIGVTTKGGGATSSTIFTVM